VSRLLRVPERYLRVHPPSLRSQPLTRAEVRRGFALMSALEARPATPALVRRLLSVLELHYEVQVRRLAPDGLLRPGYALAALSGVPPQRGIRERVVSLAMSQFQLDGFE
jgi:hypothetical protein